MGKAYIRDTTVNTKIWSALANGELIQVVDPEPGVHGIKDYKSLMPIITITNRKYNVPTIMIVRKGRFNSEKSDFN